MRTRSILTALLILGCPLAASAADSFDTTNKHLSMSTLRIGTATYSQVVVTIGTLVSGPTGTSANGSEDSYDPASNEVTVQTVSVGTATFHNVVATVAELDSIGGVTGADSYSPPNLSISFAELGGTIYDNVVVTLGSLVSVGGGMPALGPDSYSLLTNRLTIPAALVDGVVYTNAVITVGKIVKVGGIFSTVGETVLHSFSGADGEEIEAGLLLGSDGATLYGTSFNGGAHGSGDVFKVSSGVVSTVYSFTGEADGGYPAAGLIEDGHGNLYGTTTAGGSFGSGTVFMITAQGSESVLHSFGSGNDGTDPVGGLVFDSSGNFYGTTQNGGANGEGVVFKLTPGGTETVLWSFSGDAGGTNDCANPQASMILVDGNFYGTSELGGVYDEGCIFKVTPAGVESVLYSFSGNGGKAGSTDGALIYSSLIQASDGNLYGTTEYGGAHHIGTVFRLTLAGAETNIYSFSGGSTDGAQPVANLVQGSDGNFYGVTFRGGPYNSGTIFKISVAGVESVLYSFSGDVDGTGGLAGSQDGGGAVGLILGTGNTFYGTTKYGGADDDGAIFSLSDPAL